MNLTTVYDPVRDTFTRVQNEPYRVSRHEQQMAHLSAQHGIQLYYFHDRKTRVVHTFFVKTPLGSC